MNSNIIRSLSLSTACFMLCVVAVAQDDITVNITHACPGTPEGSIALLVMTEDYSKLAVYIHGNPDYSHMIQAGYIAKVIIDKSNGYVGTISMNRHDLAVYRWGKCEDFQGF